MALIFKANTTRALMNTFRQKFVENSRFLATVNQKSGSSNLLTEKKSKDIELMDPEIKEHKNRLSKTVLTTDEPMEITSINGVPKEHIYERRARISQPSKNAMQSGGYGRDVWRVDFENRERWENPLMGWTSTGDPLSNMNLWFNTKEEAAEFCEKNGWYYEIIEPQVRKNLNKTYSENFSWNKRTRVDSK